MIDRELDRLGVDKSVEVIAKGIQTALRREPVIIGMLIVVLLALLASMYHEYLTDQKRAEFLTPLIEKCMDQASIPCLPVPCSPVPGVPQPGRLPLLAPNKIGI